MTWLVLFYDNRPLSHGVSEENSEILESCLQGVWTQEMTLGTELLAGLPASTVLCQGEEVGVRGDWEKRHLGEGLPRGQSSGKSAGLRGCSRNFCRASSPWLPLAASVGDVCTYLHSFQDFFELKFYVFQKQPRTARTESTQLYLPFIIISSTTQW